MRSSIIRFSSALFLLSLAPLGMADASQPTAAPATAEPNKAAARKADEERAIDEKYQRWKNSLSPERQQWESVLEANLGTFYLPLHKRDKVKGDANAWDYVADDPKLPRVLLIGDSISRGYTLAVRANLSGKANVHRAPENCGATAIGLKKLDIWLGPGKWDLIHFNFGIHDRDTPEADYEVRLEQLTQRLLRTGAKLVWASSTPLPAQSSYGSNAAIVARNAVAARVMQRHGIPIDDLYTYVDPHLAEFQRPNDVHFGNDGYEYLGRKVAREIGRALWAR